MNGMDMQGQQEGEEVVVVTIEQEVLEALEETAERNGVEPGELCAAGRRFVINHPRVVLGEETI